MQCNLELAYLMLTDLGKFGLGLKSASFSQCQTLSILTRQNGHVSRVADDLERISSRVPLAQIPAIIIDDESDQASINTRRITPQAAERELRDRTAIMRLFADGERVAATGAAYVG